MSDEIYQLRQDKKWLEEENFALKQTLDSLVGIHKGWFIIETCMHPRRLKCYNPKFKCDNSPWRYHETMEEATACIDKLSKRGN